MALLPNKNVLDGSKTPAPTVADMKAAWGAIRDYLADLLGVDSADKSAARAALEVSSAVDVQAGKSIFAIASGAADALVITMTPPVQELVDGMEFHVRCIGPNANSAPTLTVDALPAMTIVSAGGGIVPPGAYIDKWPATFRYLGSSGKVELLNPVLLVAATSPEVRQTVLQGVTNASGYANMLSAGAGLALNLKANAMPMRTAFAQGSADYIATLSADVTGVVTGLAANNLSYIAQDYVGPISVTWSKTLAPPQCGYTYNQAAQALLHFDGSAGATTFLDDFGNTWTAQGGAKIQTNKAKFGGSALGGSGASNALNGSTDYIRSNGFSSLGGGGWALRGWCNFTSLGAAGGVFGALNSGGYGAQLTTSASGKLQVSLSSTGSSHDIVNSQNGSATLSTNTDYFVELTFDAIAGKYFVYISGILDNTVTTALKICSIAEINFGRANIAGSNYFMSGYVDEAEFLPYCDHPNGTTYSVPSSASNVATAGYASDFFSIPNKTMYQVSAASSSAGVNPTFTAKNRVYVGEVVTGSSSVSNVVNYAYRRSFVSVDAPWPANGVPIVLSSNIGTTFGVDICVSAICKTASNGYAAGDKLDFTSGNGGAYSPTTVWAARNTVGFIGASLSGRSLSVFNKTTGVLEDVPIANFNYRITVKG